MYTAQVDSKKNTILLYKLAGSGESAKISFLLPELSLLEMKRIFQFSFEPSKDSNKENFPEI